MSETTCETCRFYDNEPIKSPANWHQRFDRGHCHRFPPFRGHNEPDQNIARPPVVLGSFWCGEHRPKEPSHD